MGNQVHHTNWRQVLKHCLLSSSHMTQWHLTLPPIDYMNMMIKLKNLIHQQSKICGDFGRGGGWFLYKFQWNFKHYILNELDIQMRHVDFLKKNIYEFFLSDWILIIFSLSWCYNMVKSFLFFFKNSIIRELVNGLKYIFLTAYIYACMVCSSV